MLDVGYLICSNMKISYGIVLDIVLYLILIFILLVDLF